MGDEDGAPLSVGDVGDSERFIVSIVEETTHSTRLFTQLVHQIDPEERLQRPMETVRMGLFGHDIHTGESVFDEFEDDAKRGRLREILEQVTPVEFVVPIGGLTPATEQILLAYAQNSAEAASFQRTTRGIYRLERVLFEDQDIASSSSSNPPVVLPALARLCLSAMKAYLNSLKLESALSPHTLHIASAARLLSSKTSTRMRLSPAAFRDLGIFSDKSDGVASLFRILNHAQTSFGTRRLRDWIRFPLMNIDKIQDRQNCVEFLSDVGREGAVILETLRNDILPPAAPIERLLQKLHLRQASPRNIVGLLQSFATVESHIVEITDRGGDQELKLRSRNLLFEYPRNCVALQAILDELEIDAAAANDVESAISKQWTHYPHENIEYEAICADLEALDVKFTEVLVECRRLLDLPTLEYCSHRAGGNGKLFDHLVVVERSKVACVPDDWILVTSTKAVVRYYPRQVRVLQMKQDVLLERKAQLIDAVWLQVQASIDRAVYTAGMVAVDILADLDALSSLATAVRLYPGYVRPLFSSGEADEEHVFIVQGRHPMLDLEACQGCSYIAGDVKLSGRGAALIVSGPNMGGKSTLIRMTALLVVLAQIGMFVPADSMTLQCFDSIQTRMHRVSSRSTGADELQKLAVISRSATPLTLVLLDEVGFGLTTRQAKTLAFSTVKYLLKSIGCCILMATHMTDIAVRLREEDDANGARVQVQELAHEVAVLLGESTETGDAGVVYHYTTRGGVARRSFAFEAAAMAGIPAAILDAVAASWGKWQENQEPHIY